MEHSWLIHPHIKVYTVLLVVIVLPILVCSRECLAAPNTDASSKEPGSLMTAPRHTRAYVTPSECMSCLRHSHAAPA